MSVFIYLLTIINVVLIRCNDMKPETHLCNRSGANLSSTYNPKTPKWKVCLLIYLSKRCMLSPINCSPIQTPNFSWSNHYIWNLLSLLQAVRDSREIGHFRVPKPSLLYECPSVTVFHKRHNPKHQNFNSYSQYWNWEPFMSDQLANLSILTGCLPGGNSVVCVSLITILGYVHTISDGF